MNGMWQRRARDERGVSTAVLAVSLTALISAAVLSIDFGSLWTTRRTIITGTDAAALHAANAFTRGPANGGLDPCSSSDIATAETQSASVMNQNHPDSIHNSIETPDGFEVTLADSLLCGTGQFVPGKVRFDGRLLAKDSFSRVLGADPVTAFSSSTAAWGYITAIGEGLRPIAICDQGALPISNPATYVDGGPYPHYELYKQFWNGSIDETTYDSFFGLHPNHYPLTSGGTSPWLLGPSSFNPNDGLPYVPPAVVDGVHNGHHPVHRILMPDSDCGATPGNRIWVEFESDSGTIGTSDLIDQLLYGYKGTVALSPHDCNPAITTDVDGNCGAAPGDRPSAQSHGLKYLVCPVATPTMQCPYIFPILVVDNVIDPGGENTEYDQVAFVFIVLRGFGPFHSNGQFEIDIEFTNLQATGEIGAAPPTTDHPYQVGVQLCGADHDNGGNDRCPF